MYSLYFDNRCIYCLFITDYILFFSSYFDDIFNHVYILYFLHVFDDRYIYYLFIKKLIVFFSSYFNRASIISAEMDFRNRSISSGAKERSIPGPKWARDRSWRRDSPVGACGVLRGVACPLSVHVKNDCGEWSSVYNTHGWKKRDAERAINLCE